MESVKRVYVEKKGPYAVKAAELKEAAKNAANQAGYVSHNKEWFKKKLPAGKTVGSDMIA